MSNKYSHSRISCFDGCKLKYKYTYHDKITATGADTKLADKGSALHHTFEAYKVGDTYETLKALIDKQIENYKLDPNEYPYEEGIRRFIAFRENWFNPKLETHKHSHEQWANGTLVGVPMCGQLDTVLENDNEIIIIDFKSSKSMDTKSYQKQLMLYAYLKGTMKKWNIKEIAEKVKLYLFYPFGDVTAKKYDTIEKRALFCLKQIIFTEDDLERVIHEYSKTIKEIQATDFSSITYKDARESFACQWCPFFGSIEDDTIGFAGCKLTYDNGARQLRTTKFYRTQ